MPLVRVQIDHYKSIKHCDISLAELNLLIGENGTGKTNIMDAISYFYSNLTDNNIDIRIFDDNNKFSNQTKITLHYDLSGFKKISKSNRNTDLTTTENHLESTNRYDGYYKKIISIASTSKSNTLAVELSQIKGKAIKWNYSYDDRILIKSLFPIFNFDTRSLDITEWGNIWSILGELGKVSNNERKIIEAEVRSILLNEDSEISRKLNGISEIFKVASVDIKKATSKDFATNLAKVFFSGETIKQNGKRLDYYSAGTNSLKYIKLLLMSIDEISKTKLKEPIVFIDEPETSLHPNYIDELSDSLVNVSSKLCITLFTHSSRLTKNLILSSPSVNLFNVKMIDRYSQINRLRSFPKYSPKSRYRATDDHVNAYFSRAILFVEGETELEFFSNPYLRTLFPDLRFIDVFKAMTDNMVLAIMDPAKVNTTTPYLCLIDMDKVVDFDIKANSFKLKGYVRSSKRENLLYRNKNQDEPYIYHQKKRIEAMVNKIKVHYFKPFMSCSDTNYFALVEALHDYLLRYSIFTFSTTIEGAIINEYSHSIALDYLKIHSKKKSDFDNFDSYISKLQETDRINLLRIVFNGKSDLLANYSVINKALPEDTDKVIKSVMLGNKTSGWISEFIDEYFKNISQFEGLFNPKTFHKYLSDETNKNHALKDFQMNFPELFKLVNKICGMLVQ